MSVPGNLVEFAGRLADASAALLRQHFRQPLTIEIKADHSPVTTIDRAVESRLRDMIASEFPDHGIIGEEFGAEAADAEHVWVLDPIDGTKSFITGRPLFGTLIALCRDGRPILGVIDHPVLGTGERWIGAAGHPTRHDGTVAQVRSCSDLSAAALFCSSPHSSRPENERAFERVRGVVRQTLYSTDCYAFGLVASGFADIYVDFGLGIYDYLAAVPVIEGAGGIITDWDGAPLTIASGRRILATGDRNVHRAVLALLAGPADARTRL
jgi:inositol-phosphate phosphatase/L-galactose 1-phosphate phosphatase/histidinol-phosphatase